MKKTQYFSDITKDHIYQHSTGQKQVYVRFDEVKMRIMQMNNCLREAARETYQEIRT